MTRRRGFSTLELLAAVAVLGILLFVGLRTSDRRAVGVQTKAVAESLGDLLQNLSNRARIRGTAVGIGFPGNATFAAQGYYLLEGTETLRVTEARLLGDEFPEAWISWGRNGSDTTSDQTTSGRFNLATMSLPSAADPVLLFLPDGTLLASGLPFDGRDYLLRVGANPSGSGAPTPDAAQLTGLDRAWTVRVGAASGGIGVASDPTFPGGGGTGPTAAANPPLDGTVSSLPVVESLDVAPDLTEISPGVLSNVAGEPVTLSATARSPAGVQLFARWVKDGGQFSVADEWLPMTYSETDGLWKSSVMWSAPPTANPNYLLSIQVRDNFGNLSVANANSQVTFRSATDDWRLVFISRPITTTACDLEVMNGDGSGRTVIASFSSPPKTLVSPDGNVIATGGASPNPNEIEFRSLDGTILATTTTPTNTYGPFAWADDSSVVLVRDFGTPTRVYAVPADGSAPSVILTIPNESIVYDATGDLRYIIYKEQASGDVIRVYDRTNGTSQAVWTSPGGYRPTSIVFSPQGNYIGFYEQNLSTGYRNWRVRRDGTDLLDLGLGGAVQFSHDETHMMVENNASGSYEVQYMDINGAVQWTKPGWGGGADPGLWSHDDTLVVAKPGHWSVPGLVKVDPATGAETTILDGSDGKICFWVNYVVPP